VDSRSRFPRVVNRFFQLLAYIISDYWSTRHIRLPLLLTQPIAQPHREGQHCAHCALRLHRHTHHRTMPAQRGVGGNWRGYGVGPESIGWTKRWGGERAEADRPIVACRVARTRPRRLRHRRPRHGGGAHAGPCGGRRCPRRPPVARPPPTTAATRPPRSHAAVRPRSSGEQRRRARRVVGSGGRDGVPQQTRVGRVGGGTPAAAPVAQSRGPVDQG